MSPTQWPSHDLGSWLLLLLDCSGGICSAPREEVGMPDPTLFHCLSPSFLDTGLVFSDPLVVRTLVPEVRSCQRQWIGRQRHRLLLSTEA